MIYLPLGIVLVILLCIGAMRFYDSLLLHDDPTYIDRD